MADVVDRRKEIRRPTIRAAILRFEGPNFPIPCVVLNLTYDGAHIHVHAPSEIPDTFEFRVDSDTEGQPCHVVWRRDNELGVKFDR